MRYQDSPYKVGVLNNFNKINNNWCFEPFYYANFGNTLKFDILNIY